MSGAPQTGAFLRPELVVSWREIVGVLLLTNGPFIVTSASNFFHGSQHNYFQLFFSNHTFLLNGAIEASILGLMLIYLHWRGWRPADLQIRPNLRGTLQGFAFVPLVLFFNGFVVVTTFYLLFLCQHQYPTFLKYVIANNPPVRNLHGADLSWIVLIGAMIINACLEEINCTAYAFTEFAAKRGPSFALGLIVLLRMSEHSYQGFAHVLGIGVTFLIFTRWYWCTRNLWTIIFAHAVLDFCSLAVLKWVSP